MNGILSVDDKKIVNQSAVGHKRLRAHARVRWGQVGRLHLRDQLLQTSDKRLLAERTVSLLQTLSIVSPGKFPETAKAQRFQCIKAVEVALAITFAFERKDSIRAGVNGAIYHSGEMNPEKWKRGIRHRINQTVDQMAFVRHQLVVFAPERDDFCLRFQSGLSRDAVAVQTATIHHKAGVHDPVGGVDDVAAAVEVHCANAHAFPDYATF